MSEKQTVLIAIEDMEAQEIAAAGIKSTRDDIRQNFSALGAELWMLAHDPRLNEEEKEKLAAWVAKITWYTKIITDVFETTATLVENNLKLQKIYQSYMQKNENETEQSSDIDVGE